MDILLRMDSIVFLVIPLLFCLPECQTDPVYHQKTLIWTEMAPDKRIQVVGIAGEPEAWIKSHSPRIIGESTSSTKSTLYSSRIALGFHYSKQELYWSDIGFKEIHKIILPVKGPQDPKVLDTANMTVRKIYSGTSQEVNGLAVDWLSGSVYWTDALYNWITVASGTDEEIHRPLVLTGLDKPMGIVLHPIKGMMYWSDWGAVPKIESATLAGEKRRTLLDSSLDRPLGLTIDFDNNELYWVDDFLDTIDVMDLDTGTRRAFKRNEGARPGPASFFSIAVYQNYLFVTDQLKKMVQVFNRTSAEHIQDVFLGRVPYDIIMYDQSQQKQIGSECDILKCGHMCVSTGHGKGRCICSYGYHLNSDNRTCTARGGIRDPMFVYTIGKSLCATPVNVPDREFVDLNKDIRCFLNGTGNAMALAADVHGDSIFYSDSITDTITRVRLTLETRSDVIAVQTRDVRGMAVDWLSSNLYYTEGALGRIMVSRLQGRYSSILCEGIGAPGALTLDPAEGKMYWVDMVENIIWEANMDCSNRRSFVQRVLGSEGLAIDLHERKLYWTQQSRILSISLDGSDKKILIDTFGRTYKDVAIYQEYFAWTDGMNGIFFGEKATGRTLRGFRHLESNVSHDILGFSIYLQPVSEGGCDIQNGGCQQLCIPLPSSYICRCAMGFKLSKDRKSCTSDLVRGRFLLMADPYHKQIYQLSLDGEEFHPQGLGLSSSEFPTIMDMDTFNEVIYWGDERASVIKSMRLLDVGIENNVLDLGGNFSVTSLVVDGTLGKIAFTLTDRKTGLSAIHLSDVDGGRKEVFETINGGGTLALDERNGQLYWSNRGTGDGWKIQRRTIRSKEHKMDILWDNLGEIRDIAVSYSENKLYWCSDQTIWRADIKGGDVEVVFTSKQEELTGLAVTGDYIYLTLAKQKSLYRLISANSTLQEVTKGFFAQISDIKEYWRLPPRALPSPQPDSSGSIPGHGAVKPNRNSTEIPPSPSPTGFLGTHVPMPIVIGVTAGNVLLIILIIGIVCAIRKFRKKPPPRPEFGGPCHDNPTYVTTELAHVDNLYEGLPGATSPNPNRASRDSDLPDIVMDRDGVPLEDLKCQAQPPPLPSPRTPNSQEAGPLPNKSSPVVVSPSVAGIGGMNSFIFPNDQEQLVVNLPEKEEGKPSVDE